MAEKVQKLEGRTHREFIGILATSRSEKGGPLDGLRGGRNGLKGPTGTWGAG